MTRFRTSLGALATGAVLLLGGAARAAPLVTPLDLRDFVADPTVVVSPDGSAAMFTEDPALAPLFLVNDPFFGDPVVIVGGPGVSLLIDYDFVEGTSPDDDLFQAVLFDSDSGDPVATFERLTSESGTASFDLSALAATTLGLELVLAPDFNDAALGSTLAVSNVRLVTAAPVPLPGTLALSLSVLLAPAAWTRRR